MSRTTLYCNCSASELYQILLFGPNQESACLHRYSAERHAGLLLWWHYANWIGEQEVAGALGALAKHVPRSWELTPWEVQGLLHHWWSQGPGACWVVFFCKWEIAAVPRPTPSGRHSTEILEATSTTCCCVPLWPTHQVTYQAAHFEWAQDMKGSETNPGCVTSPVSCRPSGLGESVADGDAMGVGLGVGRAWEDPIRAK